MNRLVVLIAAIVLVPVVLVAAYFGRQLVWPSAAAGDGDGRTEVAPASRIHVPAPDVPPPAVRGPVLRAEPVQGRRVTVLRPDKTPSNRYRVRSGDTLHDIAMTHYGDSTYIQDILVANPGLDANLIHPGDEITLPPRRGETPDEPAPQLQYYVVRQGDTLHGIAKRRYGDSAMYLRIFEANRDQLASPASIIREGMRLRLPPAPTYE